LERRTFVGKQGETIKSKLDEYGSITDFTNQINQYTKDGLIQELGDLAKKDLDKFKDDLIKSADETVTSSSNLNPKLGTLASFFDFFIAGGKTGSILKKQSITPFSFEINQKATGFIKPVYGTNFSPRRIFRLLDFKSSQLLPLYFTSQ
jgi:hypothetical protein